MKKLIFISLILLFVNSAFTQATYTFTGTGNWTNAANWQNNLIPPNILPSGSTIIINHANDGECVLDKAQTIAAGATFTINTGKLFRVTGSLFMAPVVPSYKLHGLGFSPFYDGDNPNAGSYISESQISYMLQRVAPFTTWVRSYGTSHGLEKIGVNGHRQDLKVAAGAWLNWNMTTNQAEISNLIAMGQAGEIDIAVVGNEVLERGELTSSQLIGYINQVKAALPNIPVTTADNYQHFLSHPDLINALDLLYVHIHPFWNYIGIDCATYFVDSIYRRVQAAAPGKEIVIAETGWPSEGSLRGKALPSPANAATFFLNFTSWAKIKQVKYFYFEAFDESWKAGEPHGVGPHWGLWEKNAGLLKPGMESVFNGVTVPGNWLLDTTAILSDPPSIAFTYVPPLGGSIDDEDHLVGRAKGVLPSTHRVAVYIYAVCGWWRKPTDLNPLSSLQCDGSFVCDIKTGGRDTGATKIRAYLFLASYNPPSTASQAELEQNAVAWVEALRPAIYPADIFTHDVDSISVTAARTGGNISCDGGAFITAKGVCWNTTGNPTIDDPKTSDGTGSNFFHSIVTGLNDSTNYYLRAYATNSTGTAYGNERTFRTAYGLPVLTTTPIANYPGTAATGGGNITDDGGVPVYTRGVCWATTHNPTTANSKTANGYLTGSFTSSIIGLIPNTTYYVRAYATTTAGSAYGNEISFTSTQNTALFIGQSYAGGIIFHIEGSGQHGFVTTAGEQFPDKLWRNTTYITTGAVSTTDGLANTDSIIHHQGAGNYAARVCWEYSNGGFDDWFLPAKDQLNLLYGQRNLVAGFNIGYYYWSSTEYDNEQAWLQNFGEGTQFPFDKNTLWYVCAIRAF